MPLPTLSRHWLLKSWRQGYEYLGTDTDFDLPNGSSVLVAVAVDVTGIGGDEEENVSAAMHTHRV